jgi:hypothetical protein
VNAPRIGDPRRNKQNKQTIKSGIDKHDTLLSSQGTDTHRAFPTFFHPV